MDREVFPVRFGLVSSHGNRELWRKKGHWRGQSLKSLGVHKAGGSDLTNKRRRAAEKFFTNGKIEFTNPVES